MYGLLTIQELDQPPKDDALYPMIDRDGNLLIEDDEELAWQGRASNASLHSAGSGYLWQLDKVDVYITNKRIAYTCEKFTKGSTWLGIGGAGATLAGVFMLASHAKAAAKRHGKIATGHARYEWPYTVVREVSDLSFGGGHIALMMKDRDDATMILKFTFLPNRNTTIEATEAVVSQLAAYRVDHPRDQSAGPTGTAREMAIAALTKVDTEQRKGKSTTSFYKFPGGLKVPYLKGAA